MYRTKIKELIDWKFPIEVKATDLLGLQDPVGLEFVESYRVLKTQQDNIS